MFPPVLLLAGPLLSAWTPMRGCYARVDRMKLSLVGMDDRGSQGKHSNEGGKHPRPKGQTCFDWNIKCEVDHDDLPQLCLDRTTELKASRS